MLLRLDQFDEVLRCPYCRRNVRSKDGALSCYTPHCACNPVPTIRNKPVLVNATTSVALLGHIGVLGGKQTLTGRGRSALVRRLAHVLWKSGLRSRQNIATLKTLLLKNGPTPRILIVGGASVGDGMGPLYEDPQVGVISIDLHDSPYVQVIADAHEIPFADESVDAVIVQAVLEHVLDPQQVVAEIYRVLKVQGLVYSETPFLQQVHEGAYDFTRYTASGHRFLFKRFQEIEAGVVGGAGTQLLWSIDHSARALFRSRLMGLVARTLFSWVRILDAIGDRRFTADSASATYFLGRRSETSLTGHEIVAWYPGAQK